MKRVTAVALGALLLAGAACAEEGLSAEDGGSLTLRPDVGLHLAVLQGDTDALLRHIETGSDLNKKDSYGSTPLVVASTFGRPDAVRVLLDYR